MRRLAPKRELTDMTETKSVSLTSRLIQIFGDYDLLGGGCSLHAGGNVHNVAVDIVRLYDTLTVIDPDPNGDSMCFRLRNIVSG